MDLDGGTLNNQTGKLQYTGKYDTLLSLDSIPTKNGYDFVGWGRENAYPSPYSGSAIQKVEKSSDNPSKDTEEYEILSGTPSTTTGNGASGLFSMNIPVTRGETIVYMFYAKVPEGLELDIIGNHDFNYKKTWLTENQGIGTGKWELYKLEYTARADGYVSNFGYGRIKNAKKQETIRMSNITTYKTSRESSVFKYGAFSGEDYTYKAIWEPSTYTIKYVNTFNGDNKSSNAEFLWGLGELTGSVINTYTINDEIALPGIDWSYGKTFAGWYDNPEFSGSPITTIPKGSTGNKTFYAKWNYNTYNYTVDLNGGSIDGLTGINTFSGEYDRLLTFKDAEPTREGYKFKGWGHEDKDPEIYRYSTIEKTEKSSDNPSTSDFEYKITNTLSNSGRFYGIGLFGCNLPISHGQTMIMSFYAKVPAGIDLVNSGNYYQSGTMNWIGSTGNKGTGQWERYILEYKASDNPLDYIGETGFIIAGTNIPEITIYLSDLDYYVQDGKANLKYGGFTAIDGEVSALWEPEEYDITYINTFNGDNKDSANGFEWALGEFQSKAPVTYTIEDEIVLPTVGVSYGRVFKGWYDNPNFTGDAITTIPKGSVGNKTFYAKWQYGTQPISIDLNGGTIDGLSGVQSYTGEYDTTFSFNEAKPTKAGYTFKGWGTEDAEPDIYTGSIIEKVEKSADNPSQSDSEYKITSGNAGELFATRIDIVHDETIRMSFYAKIPEGVRILDAGNYVGTHGTWLNECKNVGTGKWEKYILELKTLGYETKQYLGNAGYIRLPTGSTTQTIYVSDISIYKTNDYAKFKFGKFNLYEAKYTALWEENI